MGARGDRDGRLVARLVPGDEVHFFFATTHIETRTRFRVGMGSLDALVGLLGDGAVGRGDFVLEMIRVLACFALRCVALRCVTWMR